MVSRVTSASVCSLLAFVCLACGLTDENTTPCGDDCPPVATAGTSGDGNDGSREDGSSAPAPEAGAPEAGGPEAGVDASDPEAGAHPDSGGGSADGGRDAAAGNDAGGNPQADGGGGTGGVDAGGCGTCPNRLPHCGSGNTCVECVLDEHCTSGTCEGQQCVECREHTDCTDPAAPRCLTGTCSPCGVGGDCEHLGLSVCDTGLCVECTGEDYDACSDGDDDYVCNSRARTCSTELEQSASLCEPCLSDAQCQPGQLCVLQTRGSSPEVEVGYFCLWRRGDTGNGAPNVCLSEGQPYAGTLLDATSVDGEVADVCDLALSTCPALADFRTKDCDSGSGPDDDLCGHPDVDDSRCVELAPSGSGEFRCTMRCSSQEDCIEGHLCDLAANPRICELEAN